MAVALGLARVFVAQLAAAGEPLVLRIEAAPDGGPSVGGPADPVQGGSWLEALEIARGGPPGSPASGAFVVTVEGLRGYLPTSVGLFSDGAAGESLDELGPVPLSPVLCLAPATSTSACAATAPLRLVNTSIDREHPELARTSLLAKLGGKITISATGETARLEVRGPRAFGGAVHRLRARVSVLDITPTGEAALDADDARALHLAREALAEASALWAQCGFVFEPVPTKTSESMSPPVGLLEVGCHGGLPASGGEISLATGTSTIRLPTRPGESPESVAGRLASELERRAFRVTVARNARSEAAAGPTFDLVVRPTVLDARSPFLWRTVESSDATLDVCVGSLDLADGLTHFEDETARGGTLEERVLLRAGSDGDPRTLDLLIVPYFGGRGRIGESFIGGRGASLENLVVIDRAGVRASARSATLAHEIGHILLAQPGHPDDFGRDESTRLMDADASDATAFGPRRLDLEECQRALWEHGPASELPLLEAVVPAAVSAP